jgi:hypothetical protein
MCGILEAIDIWLGDNGVYGLPTIGSIIAQIIDAIYGFTSCPR